MGATSSRVDASEGNQVEESNEDVSRPGAAAAQESLQQNNSAASKARDVPSNQIKIQDEVQQEEEAGKTAVDKDAS